MKTPKFWAKNRSIYSIILFPFSILYYFLYKIRYFLNRKPYCSRIPVICIGNINVGGSGKTPVTIEVAKILLKNGKTFCFLSKGYGGNFKGVIKLDVDSRADVVGDEPLLLRDYGDVFVSKNRVKGLRCINNEYNYDYIIMDDGLQNPTFVKNKSVLVIDGVYGFGNGCLLPAGSLRETFRNVFKRIDVVIIIDEDQHCLDKLCQKYSLKYMNGKIKAIKNCCHKKYIAFCGIGHPDKFRKTLEENSIDFVKFIEFDDHHDYNKSDIVMLMGFGLNLITTKKDWVKLPIPIRSEVEFLDITIDINDKMLGEILGL